MWGTLLTLSAQDDTTHNTRTPHTHAPHTYATHTKVLHTESHTLSWDVPKLGALVDTKLAKDLFKQEQTTHKFCHLFSIMTRRESAFPGTIYNKASDEY